MFYKIPFLLSTCVLCLALAACDSSHPTQDTSAEKAKEPSQSVAVISPDTPVTISTNNVEAGMLEQTVTDLLGVATIIQTHTLDSLTITHSEWTNESGTTSVQFQNGKVQFSQFTPSDK